MSRGQVLNFNNLISFVFMCSKFKVRFSTFEVLVCPVSFVGLDILFTGSMEVSPLLSSFGRPKRLCLETRFDVFSVIVYFVIRYQSIVFFSPSSKFVFALKSNSFSAFDVSNIRRG